MYGIVTVQRVKEKSTGGFVVLPFETSLKLVDGKATITQAVTDGTGPMYDSAYLFRVQNGYCGQRYGFMAALPDGTTPITTGEMPMVDPITGEGIYMDAQEWNELYGDLPNRVSATESRLTLLDGQGQRGYIVKQQAGRTVSVWDYINNREQLIFGDTGSRLLPISGGMAGTLRIRRVGSTVTVSYANVRNTGTGTVIIGEIPSGFRPPQTVPGMVQETNTMRIGQALSYAPYSLQVLSVGAANSYLTGQMTWQTTDPWPSTLPGTAEGSIPA